MNSIQAGILAPVPQHARHLFFRLVPGEDPRAALHRLCELADGEHTVVGLGRSLVSALGRNLPELDVFPPYARAGIDVPSTPEALWCWLRGDDRGELVHRTRAIEQALPPALSVSRMMDAFRHGSGLDLTGYEDGTENPQGAAAVEAAVVAGQGPGLDGASFVAVQQWLHDFDAFGRMSPRDQDNAIGRRRDGNEEIDDAPASAHVKRTAQESFEPAAFVLRRSMPWADAHGAGLMFVAFGRSFAAFAAQLHRMVGAEDGITDALFRFTRPVTGSYFWCPPVRDGHINLRALGL